MNSQTIGYPILSAQQKKELDKNTIIGEPIPSNDLLERAYLESLNLNKFNGNVSLAKGLSAKIWSFVAFT